MYAASIGSPRRSVWPMALKRAAGRRKFSSGRHARSQRIWAPHRGGHPRTPEPGSTGGHKRDRNDLGREGGRLWRPGSDCGYEGGVTIYVYHGRHGLGASENGMAVSCRTANASFGIETCRRNDATGRIVLYHDWPARRWEILE